MDRFLLEKLKEFEKCCKTNNIAALKGIAGDVAETAFLRMDKRLIGFVVATYSVAKFLEKPYILQTPQWKKFYKKFQGKIRECINSVRDDEEYCYELFGEIVADIEKLSKSTGRFQSSLSRKARIKAATQIYAHGASIRVAIELTGVEMKDLAEYISVTKLPEKYATKSVKERLKIADEMFS